MANLIHNLRELFNPPRALPAGAACLFKTSPDADRPYIVCTCVSKAMARGLLILNAAMVMHLKPIRHGICLSFYQKDSPR